MSCVLEVRSVNNSVGFSPVSIDGYERLLEGKYWCCLLLFNQPPPPFSLSPIAAGVNESHAGTHHVTLSCCTTVLLWCSNMVLWSISFSDSLLCFLPSTIFFLSLLSQGESWHNQQQWELSAQSARHLTQACHARAVTWETSNRVSQTQQRRMWSGPRLSAGAKSALQAAEVDCINWWFTLISLKNFPHYFVSFSTQMLLA